MDRIQLYVVHHHPGHHPTDRFATKNLINLYADLLIAYEISP